MSVSAIQAVWKNLSQERKDLLGSEVLFICVGSKQGKSTFIKNVGFSLEPASETLWTTKCDTTTLKCIEYSPSLVPPEVQSSKCILLVFSKFLQEQTGEFQAEISNANQLLNNLQCPVLFVHTFCDQTSFNISFERQIHTKYPNIQTEVELKKAVFVNWKLQKEKVVQAKLKAPIFVCSAFSFPKRSQLLDGTNIMEGIITQLTEVLQSDAKSETFQPIIREDYEREDNMSMIESSSHGGNNTSQPWNLQRSLQTAVSVTKSAYQAGKPVTQAMYGAAKSAPVETAVGSVAAVGLACGYVGIAAGSVCLCGGWQIYQYLEKTKKKE